MPILCIAGPTASGKSGRAVAEAHERGGEVISVDSRQVYRGLDIGTEKIGREEMRGVPHHLLDIREPNDPYSASDFAADAARLIEEISARGRLPILAGGTHYYFDALLNGIPAVAPNEELRARLTRASNEEMLAEIRAKDPRRAAELDPKNRRRLVRALEIISVRGFVPPRHATEFASRGVVSPSSGSDTSSRGSDIDTNSARSRNIGDSGVARSAVGRVAAGRAAAGCAATEYAAEWIVLNPPREELRARIDARLEGAFARGLVDEVRQVREKVGDARLNELGLEYRVVGEYLRGERDGASLMPALSAKLWQYARRQKAWLRKLETEAGAH